MNRSRAWMVSVVVGVVAGVGTYLLPVSNIDLSVGCALLYTLGVRLMLLNSDVLFDQEYDWSVARWRLASGALVGFVPLFIMNASLSIPLSLRFTLSLLVLGAMMTMWAIGAAHARDIDDHDEEYETGDSSEQAERDITPEST